VTFPGGKKVQAEYRGFVIQTDQSTASGGEGSAPSPFDLFLASLGTCTGYYVLAFCQKRDIPTDDIGLSMTLSRNDDRHLIERIEIAIHLPESFPERYVDACVKSAEQCAVKRHLHEPPAVTLTASRATA
jgi:putative redox protein